MSVADPRLALLALPFLLAGCSNEAGGAAMASSSVTASTNVRSPGASAVAMGKLAAPTAVKVFPTTVRKGACTFELDAPEPLRETKRDGTSVTYEGTSILFEGFAGQALDDFDRIASITKPADRLAYEKDRTPRIVVGRSPSADNPKNRVLGYGSENVGRPEGCAFFCKGVPAMEGDVVAMCKSVKITFAEKKK